MYKYLGAKKLGGLFICLIIGSHLTNDSEGVIIEVGVGQAGK